MTFSFKKTWAGTEVITASDLNGNFNNVADILNGGIKNQHISTAANIGADKISDRYTLLKTTLNLVPFAADGTHVAFAANNGDYASDQFNMPKTEQKFARHEIIAQPGMEGHLMGIGVYVRLVTADGNGAYPEVKVNLNNTLVGQGISLAASDTFYRLHSNTPFSNPLLALSDKDVIDLIIVTAADTQVAKCAGVWATIYERWSIGS